MTDSASALVSPFLVEYRGRHAEHSVLLASEIGESIIGASKVYDALAHYLVFGTVVQARTTKYFASYAQPASRSSWEQVFFVAPVANEYAIYTQMATPVIGVLFKQFYALIIKALTRPRQMETIAEKAVDALIAHDDKLISGLLAVNERQSKSIEMVLESFPELVRACKTNAERFVTPVGRSCTEIAQFAKTDEEVLLTEADADAIRTEDAEVDENMQEYKVRRVREVNVDTGHCIVEVDQGGDAATGGVAVVTGKITDPALMRPKNPYTAALHSQESCMVQAKAVRRGGKMHKLFISDLKT